MAVCEASSGTAAGESNNHGCFVKPVGVTIKFSEGLRWWLKNNTKHYRVISLLLRRPPEQPVSSSLH